ncbi:protein kinase-like domain-containing protein [Artemisia annua]|uniref:Protein kinase-like domain-containing protein n=1 Tax=Artemisia annua TaxID=35608 RepID=A0A2U1NJ55_ARTAN|nr:protein kinase-like domain-containing protein [Artemisia annua]
MRRVMRVYHVLVVLTMFVFVKLDVVAREFYEEERDALIPFRDSVKSSLNLHGNWTGPPCRNNLSRWVGIGCTNSHITHLTLESINLTGTLPVGFLQNVTFLSKLSFQNNFLTGNLPSLRNLMYLDSVILSGNGFLGPIPLDYINLPKLTTLELQENEITGAIPSFDQDSLTAFNVSYNQLSGPIPDTNVLERFGVGSYDHNSGLCGRPLDIQCPVSPPPSPSKHKKKFLKVGIIVLIAVATAVIPFSVILLLFCCYKKIGEKEGKKEEHSNEGIEKKAGWSTEDPGRTVDLEFVDKQTPVFDLDELLRASAEVLGKGSLGTTYKATMESGSIIAVKRLKEMNSLSKKEFVQQMQLVGNMKHPNLVEMTSFYYSKDEKLVIHEFIQDGSLFKLLHESRGIGRIPLNWRTRVEIMKDAAKGLIFLHESLSSQKVPHGNLKSTNILLDFTGETAHAKLTDFGYLPLLGSQQSKLAIGKCPEIMDGKKPTQKSDVYCFGVLLLEVITGKVPGDNHEDLSNWVKGVVNTDWSMDIFDLALLAEKEGHEEMLKIAQLALECTDVVPERRPKMTQILIRLEEIYDPKVIIEVS